MGIKRKGGSTEPAVPSTKRRAAPAKKEEKAKAEVEETKTPEIEGIVTPRQRARMAKAASRSTESATKKPNEEKAGLDDWTLSGDKAIAKAQAENHKREEAREERRSRGYWPNIFSLVPPNTPSKNGLINDRFQADVIVLDSEMGPAFNLHRMMNPRTNRLDVFEPCPKEWDSCPLCPPTGQYDSRWVQLVTFLNISGYTIKGGERAGEYVPMSVEMALVEVGQQPFFHAVVKEHGSLRGLHLTMTRNTKGDGDNGIPQFSNGVEAVAEPVFHSDEAIVKLLTDNGRFKEKRTKPSADYPEGEVIDARPDWMAQPIDYSEFLHKPSGEDLRQRYQAQSSAPAGAHSGSEGGEWGNSRYEPGSAQVGGGASGGGSVPLDADLDDDKPF